MEHPNIPRRLLLAACLLWAVSSYAYKGHFKPIEPQADRIVERLCQLDYENKRDSIPPSWIATLKSIASRSGNRQLQVRALYWGVRATQVDAQPQKCIPILERAKRLCLPSYSYDRALIDYQLAGNYERMSRYGEAYNLLVDAIPVFEAHRDYFFQGNAALLMAQLLVDINDPDNARTYLARSKEGYQKAGFPLNRIYYFEALLADNAARKMSLYKQSLASGGADDWAMSMQALNEISNLFLLQNRPDSALSYNQKAYRMLAEKARGNKLLPVLVDLTRVKVLYAMRRYADALAILQRLKGKNDIMHGERFLATIYEYLWKISENEGNTAEAYHYLKLYTAETLRNDAETRSQDVLKAKARETIARRNDTIRLLEKDSQLSRTYMYTAILLAAVLLLAGIAVFIYLYQRYRIRTVENRELRNNLKQEALIHSMNLRNFERDMKQKDCEISSSTLLLANKNEVLQQISNITSRYSEEGKIPQEYVQQVNNVIGDSLRNDDEWERFKLHFDSVHPNFFVKLKEASGELTENDLRLCAYIRIGMRAKQIAEMLSVSPDSVNSNRYRLRKKLGLQRGESLDDFIRKV